MPRLHISRLTNSGRNAAFTSSPNKGDTILRSALTRYGMHKELKVEKGVRAGAAQKSAPSNVELGQPIAARRSEDMLFRCAASWRFVNCSGTKSGRMHIDSE